MDLLAQSMAQAAREVAEARMSLLNGVKGKVTADVNSATNMAKSILDGANKLAAAANKVAAPKPVSPVANPKAGPH